MKELWSHLTYLRGHPDIIETAQNAMWKISYKIKVKD